MDNSIYIALSRQLAVFRDLDVTSNNIANANTTGFQTEKMMFTDYLVPDGNNHKMAFAQDIASYRDTKTGPMQVTGNPLDVAIQGPGYFMVQTPQGDGYTKAGSFQINANGTLVTLDGYPVLDDAGQDIVFEDEDVKVEVKEDGMIMVDGEERVALGVYEFANEQEMERLNSTLYRTKQEPQLAENSRIVHGMLEGSNVSAVKELVRLTELSRNTGSTAKFIEVMYDLQRKASNTWTQQS